MNPTQDRQKDGHRHAVVVHGGVGHDKRHEDGCQAAVGAALAELESGGSAQAAAVAAVMSLENDGRFNAGRGAALCLDGKTVETTASLMDTRGVLGAVAGVRNVRNPILLARAVSTTPHCLMVGEGTDRLARLVGLDEADHDDERTLKDYRATMATLQQADPVLPGVDNAAFREFWNYPVSWHEAMRRHGSGTVGAVVRDGEGGFAVATSSGGVAPALLGRAGDTPLIGCGFFCGELGAIGATGIGEAIIRRLLTRTVYASLEAGWPLQKALDAGIALFDKDTDVGLIGITPTEQATSSNQPMPTAMGPA